MFSDSILRLKSWQLPYEVWELGTSPVDLWSKQVPELLATGFPKIKVLLLVAGLPWCQIAA